MTDNGAGAAGLGTPAARWALITVWLLGIVSEAILGVFDAFGVVHAVAYAAALPGAIVLTTRGDRVLDRRRAVVVAMSALTAAALDLAGGAAPQHTGVFLFASYLLGLLIARGNAVTGAVGGAVVVLTGAVRAAEDGLNAYEISTFVAVPVAASIVGTVWRLLLRWISRTERRHSGDRARALLAAELSERASRADRRELEEVLREAGPLLEALVRGEELDGEFRHEVALVDAAVRDRIRSRWAQHPALVAAIAARRRAGVDVLLLGDGTGVLDERLAAAAARLVNSATDGSVVIRILPAGRGAALSVLLRGAGTTERTLLAEDGTVIDRR